VTSTALSSFRAAFQNVFERVVVHPTGRRKPYEVTPHARLAAIMGLELFCAVPPKSLQNKAFPQTDFRKFHEGELILQRTSGLCSAWRE
jgi:hypothetical protein